MRIFVTGGSGWIGSALVPELVGESRKAVDREQVAAHPPDLLVVPAAPDYPSLATDMLDNPVTKFLG